MPASIDTPSPNARRTRVRRITSWLAVAAVSTSICWWSTEPVDGVDRLSAFAAHCETLGLIEVKPAEDGTPAMCTHGGDPALEGTFKVQRLQSENTAGHGHPGGHSHDEGHHGSAHTHTAEGGGEDRPVALVEADGAHIAEAERDWNPYCYGTGADGYRVELIYLRPQGAVGTYEAQVEAIRNYAYDASEIFHDSAAKTGGAKHIRFRTDHGGPGCKPVVHNLNYPGANPSYSQIFDYVASQGFDKPRRRYLIFYDGFGGCGIGTLYADDRPDPKLNYNAVPEHTGYSIVWKLCWGAHTAAHELAHNFGAVQSTAPNASAAWHCTDEYDVMCYADGPGVTLRYVCPESHEFLLDCGDDDYYAHTPKGDYLKNRWNVYNSPFLADADHSGPGGGGGGGDGGDGGGEDRSDDPPPNALPVVTITAPKNNSVITGLAAPIFVSAQASASDPEDGNLNMQIRWNVVGYDDYQWGPYAVWLLPEGTWTIRARVEDSDGGVGWAQTKITTKAQSPFRGEDKDNTGGGKGGGKKGGGDNSGGSNKTGGGGQDNGGKKGGGGKDSGGGDNQGPTAGFADTRRHVFEADIARLAETGITKGCNPPRNDRFCPDEPVTRGQMAAFLARALKLPQGTSLFADTIGSVFAADISALADAGITKGCNPPQNTRFCPDSAVTRGQMAAFLVRALGLPAGKAAFTDTRRHLFEADITALAEAGITRGCNPPRNDRFCPDDAVTRGQMAAFLVRAGLAD